MKSNRGKHFGYGILSGFLTILFTLGIATGMELKDKLYGNEWDWLDWSYTVLGGAIGNLILLLIICLL